MKKFNDKQIISYCTAVVVMIFMYIYWKTCYTNWDQIVGLLYGVSLMVVAPFLISWLDKEKKE